MIFVFTPPPPSPQTPLSVMPSALTLFFFFLIVLFVGLFIGQSVFIAAQGPFSSCQAGATL